MRSTCFTPFTVRSFFNSASRREVSSSITTRLPLNRPSWESMLIDRRMSRSSFEMMLVRLFTMPMSSLPTTRNLKGLDYQLARCCTPIYGDPIFGFVTISGGIKIHRLDCPNAPELRRRYGYRVVKARWSGNQKVNHMDYQLHKLLYKKH